VSERNIRFYQMELSSKWICYNAEDRPTCKIEGKVRIGMIADNGKDRVTASWPFTDDATLIQFALCLDQGQISMRC